MITGLKKTWRYALTTDPRHYQITVLSLLLLAGVFRFDFSVSLISLITVFSGTLLTQALCQLFIAGSPVRQIDLRSPLITGLSLSLLLRADTSTLFSAWPLAAAAVIAIASKFLLRARGKHLFNPANIGIVAMILVTDSAWTTPGQWGPLLWAAFAMAGAGFFVTFRAARADVPLLFLGTYAALIFGRALWLGDPLHIPLLNLQNGALLLFAFFMISDPKTTPDTLPGRVLFCCGTAGLAYWMQYHLFITDGLFYALAIACLIRPLIDVTLPALPYQWPGKPLSPVSLKGDSHEKTLPV